MNLCPIYFSLILLYIHTAGSDFTAVAEDLTFTATNTRRCVDVDIAEDLIVENDETVILSASSTSLPTGVSIGNGMFTVTITDDDGEQIIQVLVCT